MSLELQKSLQAEEISTQEMLDSKVALIHDKFTQHKQAVHSQRLQEAAALVPIALPPLPARADDELRSVVAAVTTAWEPPRLQAELEDMLLLTPEAFAAKLRNLELMAFQLRVQERELRESVQQGQGQAQGHGQKSGHGQ
jgi:hypothetical protein